MVPGSDHASLVVAASWDYHGNRSPVDTHRHAKWVLLHNWQQLAKTTHVDNMAFVYRSKMGYNACIMDDAHWVGPPNN